MTTRPLSLGAFVLATLLMTGCASTSDNNHYASEPSQHWATCAAKGGLVMGIPGAAYSLATGGAALVAGAVLSGTACAYDNADKAERLAMPDQGRSNVLNFAFDSSAILESDEQKLNELLETMDENTRLLITGHACDIGSRTYNQGLSERRAMKVKQWLMDRGVPADHIQTMGKGEDEPVLGNDTEAMREQNRRAVISIL